MRFRRIEKDMGGMANVGLKDQHIQGQEDDVTTSNSKTYIGSKGNKKLAMNKIKNTKVGDDIHYYINGQEGRGIVVKMANEYLEVFKEDGQLGTIHINDTFFVKDILINKQWDDMDSIERYEALTKIHAPSPRYIAKSWNDMPDQIKVLLTKEGGNMAGGTGSTYEEGESKESETKDHERTGFAQNTQYSKKDLESVTKPAALPKGSKGSTDNLYEGVTEEEDEAKRIFTPNQFKQWKKEESDWSKDADRRERISDLEEEQESVEEQRSASGSQPANPKRKSDDFRKLKPVYEGDAKQAEKSDVEHGKYSNPGGTPEVGVSTDTKYDIPENTGYEERPHISVEEAGKLPRTTFNESGSELTVSGSQDSKDKPKFSQPHDQNTVRKVGVPQQHPNTYGMRYGMKGGVKKVWCPEHQIWEETKKDWQE